VPAGREEYGDWGLGFGQVGKLGGGSVLLFPSFAGQKAVDNMSFERR